MHEGEIFMILKSTRMSPMQECTWKCTIFAIGKLYNNIVRDCTLYMQLVSCCVLYHFIAGCVYCVMYHLLLLCVLYHPVQTS